MTRLLRTFTERSFPRYKHIKEFQDILEAMRPWRPPDPDFLKARLYFIGQNNACLYMTKKSAKLILLIFTLLPNKMGGGI